MTWSPDVSVNLGKLQTENDYILHILADRELLDSKDGVIRTWKRLTVATTMVGDREVCHLNRLHYLLQVVQ